MALLPCAGPKAAGGTRLRAARESREGGTGRQRTPEKAAGREESRRPSQRQPRRRAESPHAPRGLRESWETRRERNLEPDWRGASAWPGNVGTVLLARSGYGRTGARDWHDGGGPGSPAPRVPTDQGGESEQLRRELEPGGTAIVLFWVFKGK